MKREHRRILHELAEAYAVESVSYDSEPKRNVVLTAVRLAKNFPYTHYLKITPLIYTLSTYKV